MELNYKASNIAKAERELNANFFKTLEGLSEGAPSMTALLMILRAGGLSEQQADELLDNEGIEVALTKAVEALSHAGFLAKMKAKSDKELSELAQKAVASRNSGAETKA